ncbi:hypothetical protein EDC18_1074 [Natranaerovirga pectinivora]|uniref:4Fe-4S ferredoxin-type domain-containing protein n=1 Tax=Natranaerovirga pectinivora TaxID=682400 RepID=A0A4R3MK41_9FIRM|nr:4Fe-4S ferredoxin [Natranaerovirga pectinivora]TCT13936.1 hypothetical protein EDC18_1074 [Natranaerovirga pectinivora]
MKRKNHQQWSWILIISFFVLGIFDFRFGVLGLACMAAPIYHALRGRGKIHCSKYCPRGSFLGKFMPFVSFNNALPKFMRTKNFKHFLLVTMLTVFSISIIHTGFEFQKVGFVFFRFMGVSFIIGILFGIFFKPRSWCQVCPMGHGTALITNIKKAS